MSIDTTAATARPPELPAPDLDPVRRIHRADDGFIPFAAKPGGDWQNLFSVPTATATTGYHDVAPHLTTDAYFGINTMCRAGRGRSKFVPTLPAMARSTDIVRYLNAVYSDLDIYKAATPTTAEATLATVRSMVERGELPLPSFTVLSGRGVWLLWLLHDPATGLPVVGDDPNVRGQYQSLLRSIQRRLAHLGADPQSTDIPRVMRMPGSVHSGTGQRVVFHAHADGSGRVPMYTLAELCSLFPVEVRPSRPAWTPPPGRDVATTGGEHKPRTKRRGLATLFESRLRQIEKLGLMRGGYAEGCRNHVALLLADSLLRLRRKPNEVEQEVYDFGASCVPPMSEEECKYAIRSAVVGEYKFRNDTISDWLDIQPHEAEQLERWKPATRFRSPDANTETERPTRRDRRVERHQMIRLSIYQNGGELLPTRRLARLLKGWGHEVSHTTVSNDLRRMGLVGERGGVCVRAVSGPVLAA